LTVIKRVRHSLWNCFGGGDSELGEQGVVPYSVFTCLSKTHADKYKTPLWWSHDTLKQVRWSARPTVMVLSLSACPSCPQGPANPTYSKVLLSSFYPPILRSWVNNGQNVIPGPRACKSLIFVPGLVFPRRNQVNEAIRSAYLWLSAPVPTHPLPVPLSLVVYSCLLP
jgi:hypothetical protein